MIDYRIPKVCVATLATEAVDLRSVGVRVPTKIPKASTSPPKYAGTLMTRIEARQRRRELLKRLGRTREDRHLNHLPAFARCTETEDELALAFVDARLPED